MHLHPSGSFDTVRGIDLEIARGEIFALLGPNGAGKTTTLEILEGFRKRSGGEAHVLGVDPEHGGRAWRERLGIVLQDSQPEPELTARECLALYAAYYSNPRPVDDTLRRLQCDRVGRRRPARGAGADAAASFISGVYIPPVGLPSALRDVAQAFPLQHLVAALGGGFLPGTHGVAWGDLAILVAWGVAGLIAALVRFRWTPAATKA